MTASTNSTPADVAILTVIPPELDAMRLGLGLDPDKDRYKGPTGTVFLEGSVRSKRSGGNVRVVLACVGGPGNPGTSAATSELLNRYRPKIMLLVGIAAGTRGKTRIGDVVFSERVVTYEPAALVQEEDGARTTEPRHDTDRTPHTVRQDVMHYTPNGSRIADKFQRLGGVFPKAPHNQAKDWEKNVASAIRVHKSVTIASGEKLLRDPDKLLELRRQVHGKIEALEMEAAGLVEACERANVPWLVIRGISDFGDKFKDDAFHGFASKTAAAVLVDFLEHGLQLPVAHSTAPPSRASSTRTAGLFALFLLAAVLMLWASRSRPTHTRCGTDLGSSPFKTPDAIHFLVAEFDGSSADEPNFSLSVTQQVTRALTQFREEALRNPREFDIEVPEGSLEIQPLPCIIDAHAQADEVAKALDADVVIWGHAHSNIVAPGAAHDNNTKPNGGTRYTVSPKATLSLSKRIFRKSAEKGIDLVSLGHLDLPSLRAEQPFRLVEFAMGLHFYERGNYGLAARFFKKSADTVLADERNVETLDLMLGFAYLQMPDWNLSLQHSQKALTKLEGTGTWMEATVLSNIGLALAEQGKKKQGLDYFERALAIDEKNLGPAHPTVATRLGNIGNTLHQLAIYDNALEYLRRALAIDEKAFGRQHPTVAIRLNSIGDLLKTQGKYVEAEQHYRQALEISEQTLGPNHPDVAIRLNNIGLVLSDQEKYAEAVVYYRRALNISEKALGPEHPAVATRLSNLGNALQELGKYDEALDYLRRALAIDEKAFSPTHSKIAIRLGGIAEVLRTQGKNEDALDHLRRALKIAEDSLGSDHPNVAPILNNMGLALKAQGQYTEALNLYHRAIAIDEKALGSEHPNVATRLGNIGSALEAQRRYKEAASYIRRAYAIREKALGSDNPSTRRSLMQLAVTLAELSGWTMDKKKGGAVVLNCIESICGGFATGDWIKIYDGHPIHRTEELVELVGKPSSSSRQIKVSLVREGKPLTLTVPGGRLGIEIL